MISDESSSEGEQDIRVEEKENHWFLVEIISTNEHMYKCICEKLPPSTNEYNYTLALSISL